MINTLIYYFWLNAFEKSIYDIATHVDSEIKSRYRIRQHRSMHDTFYVTTMFYKEDCNSMTEVDSVSHFEVKEHNDEYVIAITDRSYEEPVKMTKITHVLHYMLWRIAKRQQDKADVWEHYNKTRVVADELSKTLDAIGKIK